jgi:hypothetical protein
MVTRGAVIGTVRRERSDFGSVTTSFPPTRPRVPRITSTSVSRSTSDQCRANASPRLDLTRCYWCGSPFLLERGSSPHDGLYVKEVGEFFSPTLNDSVLGHPYCTPLGIDAIISGDDPERVMA